VIRYWLAFTTKPMREWMAQSYLSDAGFRACVPLVERSRIVRGRRSIVQRPALRGYVFVQFAESHGDLHLHAALGVKYINRVVGFNGRPGRITEEVMVDFIAKLEEPVAIEPEQGLREGAPVRIKRGAFAELPGIVQGIEGASARVLVELFGRSCETKVSLTQLEEIDTGSLKTSSREKRRLQGTRKSGFVNVG
jgi:transcriptional antiterminator RfaH